MMDASTKLTHFARSVDHIRSTDPWRPVPPPIQGDSHAHVLAAVQRHALQLGYPLCREWRPDSDGLWGQCQAMINPTTGQVRPVGIWINPDAPINHQARTGLHELAHATINRLGRNRRFGNDRDDDAEEAVVETVAHMISSDLGLETGGWSANYVAGFLTGAPGDIWDVLQPEVERVYDALAPAITSLARAIEVPDASVYERMAA